VCVVPAAIVAGGTNLASSGWQRIRGKPPSRVHLSPECSDSRGLVRARDFALRECGLANANGGSYLPTGGSRKRSARGGLPVGVLAQLFTPIFTR
jgi:hypothetical protein